MWRQFWRNGAGDHHRWRHPRPGHVASDYGLKVFAGHRSPAGNLPRIGLFDEKKAPPGRYYPISGEKKSVTGAGPRNRTGLRPVWQAAADSRPGPVLQGGIPHMEKLFSSEHPPKTMELERTDDGRLRLVVSLSKLGQVTILEYFLDDDDVDALKKALA